jgi:transposase-like protein
MKSGKLKCGICGSDVTISSKTYGGMQRFVCTTLTCVNSEFDWDLEDTNA